MGKIEIRDNQGWMNLNITFERIQNLYLDELIIENNNFNTSDIIIHNVKNFTIAKMTIRNNLWGDSKDRKNLHPLSDG